MHVPVLLNDVIEALQPRSGGTYFDCTTGGGGHTEGILKACSPNGRVLATDADSSAIQRVGEKLSGEVRAGRLTLRQCWLDECAAVASELGFSPLDGVTMDLGLSSFQLDAVARGFSFMRDGELDMRFDQTRGMSAAQWIDQSDVEQIAFVLQEYGEVQNARRVAEAIWRARPIRTTTHLREVVSDVVKMRSHKIHPATQVFQALRIKVNDELRRLRDGLPKLIDVLKPGGRIAVISFHSLEDRIVKNCFRAESRGTKAQLGFGESQEKPARLRVVNKDLVTPSKDEVERNPRARSAKLRIAERI
jgi:16S rRNA (cytosine1402-N4)-methyltransferase